jgi:hypothetical protein
MDRRSHVTACFLILLLISLLIATPWGPAAAADLAVPVPPQYLSAPLHAPEQVQELINGWLNFAASRTPQGGAAPPTSPPPPSATFDLPAQEASTPVDAVKRLDSYQGETAITALSGRWVGGFNSIYPGSCSAALANCAPGATTSTDGVTWTTSPIPIQGNLLGFDPSLAAAAGTIYYSYGVCSGSCSSGNLMVATSTNGQTWTPHSVTPPQGGTFDDKPWVAADPTQAGRAYIAWDRNHGNSQTLLVSSTTDSGTTWSVPVKINDGTSKFERVIYAMPAVDPTSDAVYGGAVYVVWMDYARKALYVDKSTDHGLTWGVDSKAASLNVTFTDIGCNGGRSMTPAPYIAVDGQGWVYVTYADQKDKSAGMDVFLVYSTDRGGTWQGPYRINDVTTGHQYNPAMSVVGNGLVHVSWLDRRDDPKNCLTRTYSTASNGEFDVVDGTPHFSVNTQLTPTNKSSDFDGNPNGPGDYTGIVAYPVSGGTTAALSFYPTHFDTDIGTGVAGGFEAYVTGVAP